MRKERRGEREGGRRWAGVRGQSQSREAVIESGTSKKVEKQTVVADDDQVETVNI